MTEQLVKFFDKSYPQRLPHMISQLKITFHFVAVTLRAITVINLISPPFKLSYDTINTLISAHLEKKC